MNLKQCCVFYVGPSFWGLINPDWNLCNNGKRQSPINIEPKNILYDPSLSEISVDDSRVSCKPTFILRYIKFLSFDLVYLRRYLMVYFFTIGSWHTWKYWTWYCFPHWHWPQTSCKYKSWSSGVQLSNLFHFHSFWATWGWQWIWAYNWWAKFCCRGKKTKLF